ncbi:Peptidyl-prolyl cis-trans isomerase ppiD [Aequoribacter fuscus]|uniref:Periplasmic chaperone PpiD n=1 Tax=Aequoribacter fuscus TaxID=2518989 RepID=F3L154_9GAMM|nr:SurA N-terminal domain-containing protein [Aequoribacter fuscus]EGG29999.1 Peptidyl-prolyl cis-trans isomerase ppiD [Aequoribacter fuscus]QHJ88014.1 peptidylprolyl isomerase [Aequoribacter fuscus]
MLQDIRNSTQGPVFKVIVGLIVLSFALFGVESILLGGSDDSVALVNGDKIRAVEVQQAANRQKQQIAAMLGENFDPSLIDDAQLSARALEGLVGNKLQQQWAESLGLTASDVQLGAQVAAIPAFQIDGKFSAELYKQSLAAAGFTPLTFREALRVDEIVKQLNGGLLASEFVTGAEARALARVNGETRSVRYAKVAGDRFQNTVEITQDQIQAYYDSNAAQFVSEEAVVLDYITLRADDFVEPVAEADLRAAYEQEISSYAYQDEARVSHILLIQGDDEADEAYAQRIQSAQTALTDGEAFSVVAERLSDDIGSSSDGGDLGYTAGDVFPAEMEEAIKGLDINEVSGPVLTDAGTHLITVTDRRSSEPPSFMEMRSELEASLSQADAQRRLVSQVEALKDLTYTATDLREPAQTLGLDVVRSGPITRRGGQGVLGDDRVIAAAFSDLVIEEGWSEVIEVSENAFVALKLVEHQPAAPQSIEQVSDRIVSVLTAQAEEEALRAFGNELLDQLAGGRTIEDIAQEHNLEWQVALQSRRGSADIPRQWQANIFAESSTGLPRRNFAVGDNGDALLYEVFAVQAGDEEALPETLFAAMKSRQLRGLQTALQRGLSETLRDNADIEIYQ